MNNLVLKYKQDENGVRSDFNIKHLPISYIKILIGSLEKQYTIILDILSVENRDLSFDFEYFNNQLAGIIDLINTLSEYDKK